MGVGDVDVVVGVEGDAGRAVQLALGCAMRTPVGYETAVVVEGGDAVHVVVGDVDMPLAALGGTRRRDQLTIALAQVSEGAVVLAVQIEDGDPDAAFSEVPGAVGRVEATVPRGNGVGGIFEAASLHRDYAYGLPVLKHGVWCCFHVFMIYISPTPPMDSRFRGNDGPGCGNDG